MMFKKIRFVSDDKDLQLKHQCGCCNYGKYLNKYSIRCEKDGEVMHEMPGYCPMWSPRVFKEETKKQGD